MKNIPLIRMVAAFVWLAANAMVLQAADSVSVRWNEVCRAAGPREISATTLDGKTVRGYCVSVDVDEIALSTTDHQLVKVARSALARLQVRRTAVHGHALASLGKGMHQAVRFGFARLFTPAAPVALAVVPGTLAWGAVAAPFCVMGDVHYLLAGSKQINVLGPTNSSGAVSPPRTQPQTLDSSLP